MLRLLTIIVFAMPLSAEPLRFAWKAGEVHKFKVTHDTTIVETLANVPSTTSTKLAPRKRGRSAP